MNSYNLFKNAYLDLIMQSTIKDDYIDYFFKKENIKGEDKKDPKQLEMAKRFIDDIFSELNLNNPSDSFRAKKQKALLHWLRNGTITDPTEQKQKQTLQKAFNLLSKHASLNFQNFNSPIDMLNSSDKSVQKINAEYKFNPETEPKFFNKKDLGDGIIVYQVEDSKEGQAAVRKVIDSDWGYDKNPWCLAARKGGSLNRAWEHWNDYNAIPKRIAFKNGKLHAFSATDKPRTCQWWDRNDEPSESIPQTTASDDPKFLKQFCSLTYAMNNLNSPLSQDIWKKLSEDKDYKVRQQVVKNPNCPLDILRKLSEDKDYHVIASVAKNPICPLDILKKLSKDGDYKVREAVADNPNCPLDILKKLSEDKNYWVREHVAENPNCPLDILKKLSEDEDMFVIQGVAINPNCPLDILEKLANPETEKSEKVRFQAKKALQSLKNLKNKNRTQDNNTPTPAAPAPAPAKANNDARTNNTPTDVTKMRVNKATIPSKNIRVDNDSTSHNNIRINNDFSSPNNIRVDDVSAKKGTTTNTTKTNTTNKNNSTNTGSKSTFEQRMKEIQSRLNKKPSWLNK